MRINADGIKRGPGVYDITITPMIVATEGMDGSLPSLTIRYLGRTGKPIKGKTRYLRGSSLLFGDPLSAEDRRYLASLVSDQYSPVAAAAWRRGGA